MGVFGTIWDIGEAAGPINRRLPDRRAWLCLDLRYTRLITVAVSVGVVSAGAGIEDGSLGNTLPAPVGRRA